jgi:threonylcarbamoyladenosine tRNA methylthiotransferase MtaB
VFHSRAFLKIQDGCDHRCSYCRVPLARGRSLSLEVETVLARLKTLEDRGYGEAVLTGVNINQYRGKDGEDLWGLLARLLRGTGSIAIRLSSLEPEGLGASALSVLENLRIRPHFHLSIQSGSPGVLKAMRRWYGPGEIRELVSRLRSLKDDPFLGCDIIAGFPGESPGDFALTYSLCEEMAFAGIHAFPYSPRPGTAAFNFGEPVPEREAVLRVEALTALASRSRRDYARRWFGRVVEGIVETGDAPPGYSIALSENYLRLLVPADGVSHRFRLGPLERPGAERFDALGIRPDS